MKRFVCLVALALTLTADLGCVSKKIIPETPQAAAAFKADAVVIRVNELQATVIEACGPAAECQPGSLPTATARAIVAGLIDLRTVLRSTPMGWQATVKASWAQLKPKLAAVTNPAVLSALALVNAAVEAL